MESKEQIQGQIDVGFVIFGFYEDIGGTILDEYINRNLTKEFLL